jgi:hypothetical protein
MSALDDDYVTVPGQLFALMSFVAPTGTNQKNDKFGMKIRGCFATRDEANSHVKRLQQVDGVTDIYLVDMYKWLLIPPDPNAVADHEYQETFLNDLVKGYRESQLLAKQHFNERKEAIKRDGLDQHLLEHEKVPAPVEADTTTVARAMFEATDPLLAAREASAGEGQGEGPESHAVPNLESDESDDAPTSN